MVAREGLLESLSAAELEFLAGNEPVHIKPHTDIPTLQLISGDLEGLKQRAGFGRYQVPLWLARQLKRSKLCDIEAPSWLCTGALEGILQAELREEEFQPLPFHYIQVATVLLECAADNIPDAEQVRVLLQRIRECRQRKIQLGLPIIDGNPLSLDNLGHMELNEMRPFLLQTLDCFLKLGEAERDEQMARTKSYSAPRSSLFSTQ